MGHLERTRTQIGRGGRIVVPVAYRRALGLKPGDEVLLVLDDTGLHVMPAPQAVARAQALVKRYVNPTRRLAAELITERKRESRRE